MKETTKSPPAGEAKNGVSGERVREPKLAEDFIQVPFGQLIINLAVNVRQTYRAERVAQLVEQIKADGLRRPLDICFTDGKAAASGCEVLAGFTRCKALEVIYGKAVGEYMVTCRVNRSKVPGQPLSPEEKMMINLASDETQEPVKQSELAARVHYMVKEMGIRHEVVAKRCFVDSSKVGMLTRLWEKLHPEIKDAWTKAPSREAEIPLTHLASWVAYPPDQQLVAFRTMVAPPSELDEQDEDAEVEGALGPKNKVSEKPPILWRLRSKKEIMSVLIRLKNLQKEEPNEFKEEHEGALRVLRWALSAEGTKNREGLQKPPY